MFGLEKREKEMKQVITAVSTEETTELKEYISIDNIKAHLVDTLEENRRLRKEVEENRDYYYKRQQEEQKKAEVALIEADEWKKRTKEKDEEIKKLKKAVNEQDVQITKLEREQNSLKTDAEMAREEARKTRERYAAKKESTTWLKDSLEKYCGYEWEKVTKTQLVSVLKTILKENEDELATGEEIICKVYKR